jgi:8-oxo-dGTP diphosphatase
MSPEHTTYGRLHAVQEHRSKIRAQCIVHRGSRILMVQHDHQNGETYWCLPGGGVEQSETAADGALRELQEECGVDGIIVREVSHTEYAQGHNVDTFLVDIGDQTPHVGTDPELQADAQILTNVAWLTLPQLPERDRAYLWTAGLLAVADFPVWVSR